MIQDIITNSRKVLNILLFTQISEKRCPVKLILSNLMQLRVLAFNFSQKLSFGRKSGLPDLLLCVVKKTKLCWLFADIKIHKFSSGKEVDGYATRQKAAKECFFGFFTSLTRYQLSCPDWMQRVFRCSFLNSCFVKRDLLSITLMLLHL